MTFTSGGSWDQALCLPLLQWHRILGQLYLILGQTFHNIMWWRQIREIWQVKTYLTILCNSSVMSDSKQVRNNSVQQKQSWDIAKKLCKRVQIRKKVLSSLSTKETKYLRVVYCTNSLSLMLREGKNWGFCTWKERKAALSLIQMWLLWALINRNLCRKLNKIKKVTKNQLW